MMKITVYRKHTWTEAVKNILQWLGDNSGCHQRPDRSFQIRGWQFPLCARCAGVTAGQLAAVLAACFKWILPVPCAFLFLLPLGIDWGVQEAGWKESTNRRRFLTGFFGGMGLFSLYLKVLLRLLKKFLKVTNA